MLDKLPKHMWWHGVTGGNQVGSMALESGGVLQCWSIAGKWQSTKIEPQRQQDYTQDSYPECASCMDLLAHMHSWGFDAKAPFAPNLCACPLITQTQD